MNAAMYLRKSRAEDGLSVAEVLARHKATLTEFAAAHGIHIVEEFREVKSGESLVARPEMLRLLEAVEAGLFDAVLCMDLDRLSRGGTRDRGLIWETFKNSETLIVTPGKTYDLNTESDELMTEFYGLFASMELRQIKKRLNRGRERSSKEGYFISTPPYGYRRVKVDRRPSLEVYEPEAKFVRLAFDWYVSGVGCQSIADKLNTLGARPHRTDAFSRGSVVKILRNPAYAGKVAYNREKPDAERIFADGLHPAIITPELWETCQRQMSERATPPTRDNVVMNPLRGLVRCEKCGRLLQRVPVRDTLYMCCPTRGCAMSIRLDFLEAAVIDALEVKLSELESEPDSGKAELSTLEAELSELDKALKQAESRKTLLFDLLEDGTYTRADFTARMDKLKEHVAALRKESETVRIRLDAARNADRHAQADAIRTALDVYQTSDAAGRNALLRGVVDTIWAYRAKGTKPLAFSVRVVPKF